MILAVASGKGGTGKTTVSVNLAWMLGSDVWLLDCDVEEPHGHLFLKGDRGEKHPQEEKGGRKQEEGPIDVSPNIPVEQKDIHIRLLHQKRPINKK